jgi:hypothetical protein
MGRLAQAFLGDGLSKALMVEVLGRYSNHPDQGERLARLLKTVPRGSKTVHPRTPRRVLRRLNDSEVDEIATAYQAGATLSQLAAVYKSHTQTISRALERRGVSRRFRLLQGDRLEEAIQLYGQGQSLAKVGARLSVSPDAVADTFRRVGVRVRPKPGTSGV